MKVLSFAAFVAVVILPSCNGLFTNDAKPDGSNPHVTINSPTSKHTFTKANGVSLNLSVVDKDEVKELGVKITDTNGVTVKMEFKKAFSQKVVLLDTLVAVNQLQPGTYHLYVSAKDKKRNEETSVSSFDIID